MEKNVKTILTNEDLKNGLNLFLDSNKKSEDSNILNLYI